MDCKSPSFISRALHTESVVCPSDVSVKFYFHEKATFDMEIKRATAKELKPQYNSQGYLSDLYWIIILLSLVNTLNLKNMKTLFLFFALLPFVAFAQEAEPQTYQYAEIVGQNRTFRETIHVTIDYGQEPKAFINQKLIINKSTGKAEKFNSMIDALNYMSSLGWEFVQAYVVPTTDSGTTRWILKRKLSDEELEEYLPAIKSDVEPSN